MIFYSLLVKIASFDYYSILTDIFVGFFYYKSDSFISVGNGSGSGNFYSY